jgi:hypothetical protein
MVLFEAALKAAGLQKDFPSLEVYVPVVFGS